MQRDTLFQSILSNDSHFNPQLQYRRNTIPDQNLPNDLVRQKADSIATNELYTSPIRQVYPLYPSQQDNLIKFNYQSPQPMILKNQQQILQQHPAETQNVQRLGSQVQNFKERQAHEHQNFQPIQRPILASQAQQKLSFQENPPILIQNFQNQLTVPNNQQNISSTQFLLPQQNFNTNQQIVQNQQNYNSQQIISNQQNISQNQQLIQQNQQFLNDQQSSINKNMLSPNLNQQNAFNQQQQSSQQNQGNQMKYKILTRSQTPVQQNASVNINTITNNEQQANNNRTAPNQQNFIQNTNFNQQQQLQQQIQQNRLGGVVTDISSPALFRQNQQHIPLRQIDLLQNQQINRSFVNLQTQENKLTVAEPQVKVIQSPVALSQQQKVQKQQILNTNTTTVQQNQVPHVHQYVVQVPSQQQRVVIQQNNVQQNQLISSTQQDTQIQQQQQQQQQVQEQTVQEVKVNQTQLNIEHPELHELYHIEREIQVLSVEDVEEPWKRKCVELEIIIYDLQTELAKQRNVIHKESNQGQYETTIRELEVRVKLQGESEKQLLNELKNCQEDIEQWRTRYSTLQREYTLVQDGFTEMRKLRQEISIINLDELIQKLKELLEKRDEENQNLLNQLGDQELEREALRQTISELENEISSSKITTEQITFYQNEVASWKNKFIELNRNYHQLQEELFAVKAELDALRNKKTITQTERIVTSTTGPTIRITQSQQQQTSSSSNKRTSG